MVAACLPFFISLMSAPAQDWQTYGGNPEGQHYSSLKQINRSNVRQLRVAWTFHTETFKKSGAANARASFEANPVLWDKTLYLDTPFDEIIALDAETGRKRWSFDPGVDRNAEINIVTSRGVALWHSASRNVANCAQARVFVATLDRRLLAVDAHTGKPCRDFGRDGSVDLAQGVLLKNPLWYEFTSPPTIVGDIVVLGSTSGDNQAVEVPSGTVRAFDARTGNLLWSWEPLPWARRSLPRTGSGGAWSVISADLRKGLLFVPTGSPSLDFYGVYRPGDNRDANSVVALEAATGKRVWGFQVVHHDLWDFDVAAEPLLFDLRGKTPAVAVTTKMGMVFVLNRLTGQPLFPVMERPVPQSDIPGEKTAATQPFSSLPPLSDMTLSPDDVFGKNAEERKFCHDKVAALVNKGIYTPIGLKTTLLYPGSIGGVNWGSPAFNPETGIMFANVNQIAFDVRLVPRDEYSLSFTSRVHRRIARYAAALGVHGSDTPVEQRFQAPDGAGHEMSIQDGSPYWIFRESLLSPSGLPCTPQPWGSLVALNLNTGKKEWSRPLGTMIPGRETGSITLGGPIVTGSGLVFSAATVEPLIRAYDQRDGAELWRGTLPAPAQSTPMTYQIGSKQYLVICAGGHGGIGTQQGDAVVAFALP